MSYRPRPKGKNPWLVIGLNITLLIFLLVVVKKIVLESDSGPQTLSYLKIDNGQARIEGASARIPVERPKGGVRILILGGGPFFDGDADAVDKLTVETAKLLPKSPVEIYRLHFSDLKLSDLPNLLNDCRKLHPTLIVIFPIVDMGILSVAQQSALLRLPMRKKIQWLFDGPTPAGSQMPEEILADPAKPRKFLAHIAIQAAKAVSDQSGQEIEFVDLIENPDPDLENSAAKLERQTLWALDFVIGNALRKMTADRYHVAMVGMDPKPEGPPKWAQIGPLTCAGREEVLAVHRKAAQHLRAGENEKARAGFEQALSLAPQNVAALWGLAEIYRKQGNTKLQNEYMARAMENDAALASLKSLPKAGVEVLAQSAHAAYLDYDVTAGGENEKLRALAFWMAHNL